MIPRSLAPTVAFLAGLAFVVFPANAEETAGSTYAAQDDTYSGSTPQRADTDTDADKTDQTYSEDEITHSVADFFGMTTETAAKAVERVFSDQGEPDGYIKGEEGSGAFIVGLRYGSGWLVRKGYKPVKVYWKGPSVGFDVGGNGSKCFTLVYNLRQQRRLYQRFPGVEGSFYFIAGIGVNYMRSGGVTLAPMRTGIGLRAGVNAHYQVYSDRRDWFPL
jgi:hypothetical protein